jgi:hypothetical protein
MIFTTNGNKKIRFTKKYLSFKKQNKNRNQIITTSSHFKKRNKWQWIIF